MNDVINIELKELGINYKMYAPNRKTNLIERIVDNTKQPYEYEMLLTMANELCLINPKKNKTILDIGMNIGNHALFFAALGYKVIGIEANPKMSAIAKKSVEINGFEDKIKIIECGVSDKDEILYFKEEIPENFGAMHLETKGQGQEIKCRRIDDLGINEEICLLKMDIEGIVVNDKCKSLACKIREIIDAKSSFADWLNNQRVRDQLKQDIKICLVKNGYPPQYTPEVFREVMEQVENFKENEGVDDHISTYVPIEEEGEMMAAEPFECYKRNRFDLE